MEFLLAFTIGWFIMFLISKRFFYLADKDIEKLKDFEKWKEWKNKKK
jgi:hypothetical protein